jgi:hypothetical protein
MYKTAVTADSGKPSQSRTFVSNNPPDTRNGPMPLTVGLAVIFELYGIAVDVLVDDRSMDLWRHSEARCLASRVALRMPWLDISCGAP